jgi:uncharacterized protein HemY
MLDKPRDYVIIDLSREREVIRMERVSLYITEEEAQAVKELLDKMRAERAREEAKLAYKNRIQKNILMAVEDIGLEDTKRIVRELVKELREQ